MNPELVILGIQALQGQYYANDEDWFYDRQTVDQLVDTLTEMAENGEEL
jgi:hypothetical protein